MALQTISIPLAGVDAGSDPKASPAPLRIENALFSRDGALTKRTGHAAIANPTGGSVIDSHMAALGAAPVVVGDLISTWTGARWVDTGDSSGYRCGLLDIYPRQAPVNSASLHYYADIAEHQNVYAIIYTTKTPGTPTYAIQLDSFDRATHVRLDSQTLVSGLSTVRHGKLAAIGGGVDLIYAYWFDGSNALQHCSVNTLTGVIASSSAIAGATCAANYRSFDTCVVDNSGTPNVILAFTNGSSDVGMNVLPLGTTAGMVDDTFAATVAGCVGCFAQSDTTATIVWNDITGGTTDNINAATVNLALATPILPTPPASWTYARTTAETLHVSGLRATDTTGYIFVGRLDQGIGLTASSDVPAVHYATYSSSPGALSAFKRGCRLAAKPWRRSSYPTGYVGLMVPVFSEAWGASPPAQGTVRTLDEFGNEVGRALVGTARTDATLAALPQTQALTSSWLSVCKRLLREVDNSIDNRNVYGLQRLEINAAPTPAIAATRDALAIGAGCPYVFDGAALVEHGFAEYPEDLSLTASNGSGTIAAGTYYYRATWERIDNGRTIRSAPTPTAAYVVVASPNDTVTVKAHSQQFTRHSNAQLVIWRTIANGSTYYRIGSVPNDTGSFTVSYTDISPDSNITDNEVLYTHGEVENTAPPPHLVSTVWQQRHVVVARDSGRVFYSKRFSPGLGIEHSGLLEVLTDDQSGPYPDPTGLAPLLDKLVVFYRSKTYAVDGSGGGLNAAAQGNNYPRPYLVSSSVGCVNWRTIATVDDGVMFLAEDGIWLLTRGLQLVPLGEPVRYWTDTLTLVRAVVLNDRHQVLWLSNSATALAYDWLRRRWSTYTAHTATDGVVVDDVLYRLTGGVVYKDNRAIYTDNGSGIGLKVVTGWIPTPGVVRRVKLKGYNVADHTLRVRIGYNGDPAWADSVTLNTNTLENSDFSDHYGAGLTLATYDEQGFLLQCEPSRQGVSNVESIRFEISDESNTGAGFALTHLLLDIETEDGVRRLGTARSVTGV